jgi:hypothetical protein
MKQYDYDYATEDDLVIERGTQQLPELVKYLKGRGQDGWRVVHASGEFESQFVVLLERELFDAAR